MQAPVIDLFGIQVAEPMTWITDWLVAGFTLFFGYRLFYDPLADVAQKFWALFFFFLGFASISGGIAHGFSHYIGPNFHYSGWILSGISVFCAQLAVLQLVESPKIKSALRYFIYAELIVMVSSVMIYQHFNSVVFNSFVGLMGIVMTISLNNYRKVKDRRSYYVVLGILANLIPAAIHVFNISINQWFNSNDISHIVMIYCFYLLYKGARENGNVELTEKLKKAPVRN